MEGELDELATILSTQPDFEKAATDTATGKRGPGRPPRFPISLALKPKYARTLRVNDDICTSDPETLRRDRQTILKTYRPEKSKGRTGRLALLETVLNSNPALGRLRSARACAAHLIRSQPGFEAQKLDSLRKDVAALRRKLARQLG